MKKKWRCFFCDEVFTTRKAAWAHFGDQNCETDPPACVDPLRADEEARLTELRQARQYALKAQNDSLRIEERMDGLLNEHDNFFRYFGPDCRTMWQAGDRYKNVVFENGLLKENVERLTQEWKQGQQKLIEAQAALRQTADECKLFDGNCKFGHKIEFERIVKRCEAALGANKNA